MKFKLRLSSVKIAIKILVFIFAGIAFYYTISHALTPVGYKLDIDGGISPERRVAMGSVIEHEIHEGRSLKDMRNNVMASFPEISKLSIRMLPQQALWVKGELLRPVCIINNNRVMLDKKKSVYKECFYAPVLEGIPNIRVEGQDSTGHNDHSLYYDFITQLPPNFFDTFSIFIHDSENIECRDKADESWSLILTKNSRVNEHLLIQCAKIKEEHRQRPGKKYVDLRFKDMLVFSKK